MILKLLIERKITMKIKVAFIHPYNYGNLMMASVFIQNMIDYYKTDIEIVTDVENEDQLNRLIDSLYDNSRNVKFSREEYFDKKYYGKLRKVKKLFQILRFPKYCRKKYNAVVFLGGDCLSEYYSKIGFLIDGYKIFKLSKKIPVFLVGQTLGPFTSYRKYITQIFLKNSYVFSRDKKCFDYCKETLHLDRIYDNRDLAFLDIPKQNDDEVKKQILNKYNLSENNYVTIVPSGLYRSYTSNLNDYLTTYVNIIEEICTIKDLVNMNIVILPHVIHNENSDDLQIIKKLEKLLFKSYHKNRVKFIKDIMMPHEARIILGNGIFTLTGRMHAAVSTLQMKKPAISLSYSVKYAGVIGHGLDLMDLVIECKGDELWKSYLNITVRERIEDLLTFP